jgi:hypothetical protein
MPKLSLCHSRGNLLPKAQVNRGESSLFGFASQTAARFKKSTLPLRLDEAITIKNVNFQKDSA